LPIRRATAPDQIEIDHVSPLGSSALLEAIILGGGGPRRGEVVRLLIHAGADVARRTSSLLPMVWRLTCRAMISA